MDVFLPPYLAVPAVLERSVGDAADWGHQYVNPGAFFEQGYTGRGVVVFVLDTGIDDGHPDLIGKVIHRRDFTDESTDIKDANGHGTWCASRIAALQNELGVLGIAPGAVLVDLRVLTSNGSGSSEWVAQAYRYAADVVLPEPYHSWRRITSVSLGSKTHVQRLKEAVAYAAEKGVINVAASGNDGHATSRDTVNYPAKYDHCIAVGAQDQSGGIARYSSAGPALDVVAPGSKVLGAYRGDWAYLFGTSMATPHVAGAIALLLDAYGEDLPGQRDVETYLQQAATDLLAPGWDILSGHGAVILTRFAEQAPGSDPGPPTPPPVPPSSGCLPAWIARIFNLNNTTNMSKEVKTQAETDGRYGYAEIVDTLTDLVKAEMLFRRSFAGTSNVIEAITAGVQVALSTYPKVKEAIGDWQVFEQEVLDLSIEEGQQVQAAISAAISDDERTQSRAFRVITFATEGYRTQAEVRALLEAQLDMGKWIFARQ